MKHSKPLYIVGAIVLVLAIGFTIPRLIPHKGGLSAEKQKEVLMETAVSFDAPLLELAAMPTYRVNKVEGNNVTVGVYGWFGWHVADVHLDNCSDKAGFSTDHFACEGGTVDYLSFL